MSLRTLAAVLALAGAATLVLPVAAEAQITRTLRRAAERAVESETERQVARLLRNAIRCLIDDPICVERARADGKEVVFVDDKGEVVTDEGGTPITDRDKAIAAAPRAPAPGEGAWANYDFVPGDEIVFYDDFSGDNVGDFPRRFELIAGNWDIVEWEGARYLRATGGGVAAIPLPTTLPERFTMEVPVSLRHGNASVRITTGRAFQARPHNYTGSAVSVEATRTGLYAVGAGPSTLAPVQHRFDRDGVAILRIMADGAYMKVYLDEKRVTNAPNALFPRTDTLFLAAAWANEERPILLGSIRVAGGGRDLYDRLDRDGRVATHGILFATNSDRIRPESTPTLEEIGGMLEEHPELRLGIEGHTDSEGEETYNRDLSERRAASVARYLVERHGVDAARIEATGFGESRPVADNGTAEGRQQNRRVELVRLATGG